MGGSCWYTSKSVFCCVQHAPAHAVGLWEELGWWGAGQGPGRVDHAFSAFHMLSQAGTKCSAP